MTPEQVIDFVTIARDQMIQQGRLGTAYKLHHTIGKARSLFYWGNLKTVHCAIGAFEPTCQSQALVVQKNRAKYGVTSQYQQRIMGSHDHYACCYPNAHAAGLERFVDWCNKEIERHQEILRGKSFVGTFERTYYGLQMPSQPAPKALPQVAATEPELELAGV